MATEISDEDVQSAIDEFVEAGIPKPLATKAVNNMLEICRAIEVLDDGADDKEQLAAVKYLANMVVVKRPFRAKGI